MVVIVTVQENLREVAFSLVFVFSEILIKKKNKTEKWIKNFEKVIIPDHVVQDNLLSKVFPMQKQGHVTQSGIFVCVNIKILLDFFLPRRTEAYTGEV